MLLLPPARAESPALHLSLTAPIVRWDEAIPLGNGVLGGLLWGSGDEIRLSIDRGDLWDLRRHPSYVKPAFKYSTVVDMVRSGNAAKLNQEHAVISDFPTRLPGARLVIRLGAGAQAHSFDLDMARALGGVTLGPKKLKVFFPATEPVALLLVPGAPASVDLVPNQAVRKLGYDPPVLRRENARVWLLQKAALGLEYAVYAVKKPVSGGTLIAVTIATNGEGRSAEDAARQMTARALERGIAAIQAEHERWWRGFWSQSSITLPDEAIARHYHLVRYLYGAGSRPGSPPMALQGLWTSDDGELPPWRGDYHHNLNTQLTYWAYLHAGHFDQGLAFLDYLWKVKPVHERFAREFFGVNNGIIMPAVTALDGQPMGSWFPVTLEPTMGAWNAQAFYLHWRYTMDRAFLASRAYPYAKAIGEGLAALLQPDPNGRLKLPLSSSPEIHGNSPRAWLTPNSNCDLALLSWLFGANEEMASELGEPREAERWKLLRALLDPLSLNEAGELLVAPGEPLTESHRHHSHLMAIHPLGLVHVDSDQGPRTIAASLAANEKLGTEEWCGYSFSWMAAMRARVGQGDEALRYLSDYLGRFTRRNGFHVNYEASQKRGRPFTLEGNFAAAQAVHEMLLQSWGGRLRVFPAIPAAWSGVSFDGLRSEGGFRVSARRTGGRTREVTVQATVDQLLRLRDPFRGGGFETNLAVQQIEGDLVVGLRAGETLRLREVREWAIRLPRARRTSPATARSLPSGSRSPAAP
ncbi:MAG TPA: hypothetical protein DEH78_20165 [Solibacterales bacterium]|nr:hypothetical protein [Bryobacterales bacterium]